MDDSANEGWIVFFFAKLDAQRVNLGLFQEDINKYIYIYIYINMCVCQYMYDN